MHKWCASEIKEQPGLIPQMTEIAQPAFNLRHGKGVGAWICGTRAPECVEMNV